MLLSWAPGHAHDGYEVALPEDAVDPVLQALIGKGRIAETVGVEQVAFLDETTKPEQSPALLLTPPTPYDGKAALKVDRFVPQVSSATISLSGGSLWKDLGSKDAMQTRGVWIIETLRVGQSQSC